MTGLALLLIFWNWTCYIGNVRWRNCCYIRQRHGIVVIFLVITNALFWSALVFAELGNRGYSPTKVYPVINSKSVYVGNPQKEKQELTALGKIIDFLHCRRLSSMVRLPKRYSGVVSQRYRLITSFQPGSFQISYLILRISKARIIVSMNQHDANFCYYMASSGFTGVFYPKINEYRCAWDNLAFTHLRRYVGSFRFGCNDRLVSRCSRGVMRILTSFDSLKESSARYLRSNTCSKGSTLSGFSLLAQLGECGAGYMTLIPGSPASENGDYPRNNSYKQASGRQSIGSFCRSDLTLLEGVFGLLACIFTLLRFYPSLFFRSEQNWDGVIVPAVFMVIWILTAQFFPFLTMKRIWG